MLFNSKLIKLLKTDRRFLDDDDELIVAAVQDKAWNLDRDLVKLLLSDPDVKAKFFEEIEEHWIFNFNAFIDYISQKNFLDNSYTRFKNRIGLTIGGKFLRERGEVALVWPYKDCVLEGGQTKEEEKRKEIFFNEGLAQDEINRLLDPKVLTNFVRYTANGKEPVTEFKHDENRVIRENLIIKGNNLLALHTLKSQFRGQVKLIYIDPPYNTGNDSFGYNDNFNHSTWLMFMKNRLEIAISLLHNDGFIFVQVDENEQAYLKIILDEIFGRYNLINQIVVQTKPSAGASGGGEDKKFKKNVEYLLAYAKTIDFDFSFADEKEYFDLFEHIREMRDTGKSWKYTNVLMEKGKLIEEQFTEDGAGNKIQISKYKGLKRKSVNEIIKQRLSENKNKDREEIEKAVYREFFDSIFSDTNAQSSIRTRVINVVRSLQNDEWIEVEYTPRTGKYKGKLVKHQYVSNTVRRVIWLRETAIKTENSILKGDVLGTLWQGFNWNNVNKEGGTLFSSGKKPEELLRRIIDLTTEKTDIVLDFFSGSGTTTAVAHKMGRQYIGIEQLEYGKNDMVKRLENVIRGDQTGISDSVNWQGGGDFIYCELMKYNEAFMERIQAANSSKELLAIWQDMSENSFLNWYVNPSLPEAAVNDFIALGNEPNGLEKQKHLLAELLDKNQLYVNLSEIDDAQFKVSDEDKRLNRAFYGK